MSTGPQKNYARRNISDAESHRQRTTLISLSIVLIIFALAGGQVSENATLLSLPIKFSRPIFLLVAAWVIWAYYLYRFRLTTAPPWKLLREEVQLRTLADPKVREICIPALPRFEIDAENRALAHRQVSDGWTLSICTHNGRLCFDPTQFYKPMSQATPSGAAGQTGFFPLNARERRTFRFAVAVATVRAMLLEWTFSEKVLPYFLVLLTPLVWVFAYRDLIWDWCTR